MGEKGLRLRPASSILPGLQGTGVTGGQLAAAVAIYLAIDDEARGSRENSPAIQECGRLIDQQADLTTALAAFDRCDLDVYDVLAALEAATSPEVRNLMAIAEEQLALEDFGLPGAMPAQRPIWPPGYQIRLWDLDGWKQINSEGTRCV